MLESLDPVYRADQDKHELLCSSKQAILEKCFTQQPADTKDAQTEEKKEQASKPWEKGRQNGHLSIYDEVEDQEAFHAGIKRRMFFQTLRSIYGFQKQAWAKQTVIQILKKVYLEK